MIALKVVRFSRNVVWAAVGAFALYRAIQLNSTVFRMQASAMQEISLIGFALVDLAVAYLLAKALDVGFELQERRLKEK